MEINKSSDLIALHRAIVEAKFKEEFFDNAIPYSGTLATISNEIVLAIIDALIKEGESERAHTWAELRKLSNDWYGYQCIQNRILETRSWVDMSAEDKSQFIRVLCSPYQPSMQQENDLIEFGDRNWKT